MYAWFAQANQKRHTELEQAGIIHAEQLEKALSDRDVHQLSMQEDHEKEIVAERAELVCKHARMHSRTHALVDAVDMPDHTHIGQYTHQVIE